VQLDLDCVASLVALVEEGSYRRAGERLHLSTSALSRRIQRLERQVGAQLLVRGPDGVVGPTAAGWRFETRARPLLAAGRAARAAAHDAAREPVVHLGVHGPVGDFPEHRHLVEVARRLRRAHPHVRLVCRGVALEDMYTSLFEGAVDVLWGAYPPAPAAIEVAPLLRLQRVCVVPAAHDLADAEQVPAAELVDRPLLYIPAVSPQVMSPFVLGDVRPTRDARLVPTDALDSRSIIARLRPQQAVVIGESSWPASLVRPGLHEIRLPDLPPVEMFVARRRSDRREFVTCLAEILPGVATAMLSDMRALWSVRAAAIAGTDVPRPEGRGGLEQYAREPTG
jgi:DNA-binding transcriptional LysR family regulator